VFGSKQTLKAQSSLNKLTRFKNAKIGIDRCPDHDAPTAVLVQFTYTIVCKAFITTSVGSNPPISMVNVKPGLVGGCLCPTLSLKAMTLGESLAPRRTTTVNPLFAKAIYHCVTMNRPSTITNHGIYSRLSRRKSVA